MHIHRIQLILSANGDNYGLTFHADWLNGMSATSVVTDVQAGRMVCSLTHSRPASSMVHSRDARSLRRLETMTRAITAEPRVRLLPRYVLRSTHHHALELISGCRFRRTSCSATREQPRVQLVSRLDRLPQATLRRLRRDRQDCDCWRRWCWYLQPKVPRLYSLICFCSRLTDSSPPMRALVVHLYA